MRKHRLIILGTALAALVACNAWSDEISDTRRNAIVKAIEKVAPAVVTINVIQVTSEAVIDPFFNMFNFGPAPIRQRAVEGTGTGFIFDKAGHILTNYHVLQGAQSIASVTLSNGKRLDVEVVGADERSDLAVLHIRNGLEGISCAVLGNSDDLMIGEWVIAIGNPFANMIRDPQPSVSVGVVSANHRRVSREVGGGTRLYQDLIQTDAAINPGNSGGPLVNSEGSVVGVNTMIFSNSGGYQGLGFAIPISRVKRVVDDIIKFGRRRDPWFGFKGQALSDFDPSVLQRMGIKAESGVMVVDVQPNSPVANAGLNVGDVVVAVNAQPVEQPTDVDYINWSLFIGDPAILEIDRQGTPVKIKVTVQEVTH